METSCVAQHSTHLSWLTSTEHCCSTWNTDQHLGCRYDLVLIPITKVVRQALPEAKCKTTKIDLHYCDLEKLPLEALLCMCDWLKLALDLFSKTTGAMLLQDGLDEEDMQVISQARVWLCQAVGRAARHCTIYTISLPCVSFSSNFGDHALQAASRPRRVMPIVSMSLLLFRMQHVVYVCVKSTCQCESAACLCTEFTTNLAATVSSVSPAAAASYQLHLQSLRYFCALCSSRDFVTGTSSQ